MNTNILNQLESELKTLERQKRNDLNNCYFNSLNYYDVQILGLEQKIKKIKDVQNVENLQANYIDIILNEDN